jgi:hypothetical protein
MRTELKIVMQELPAAGLGNENPFPFFRDHLNTGYPMKPDDSLSEEDTRYLGWNVGFRVLPYRLQDGYDRHKKPTVFRTVVLENNFLRATFWTHLGGRLMSLFDKEHGRELLENNPVFQPANLGLRNAWFSGGIEWNPSHPGHHFHTCDPVFAARVDGPGGEPVLRLYEWDRVKCFPWQIDFYLPSTSRFLFSRVRLVNPHDHELPMYWWTNMAVPEQADHRVVVPADEAIYNSSQFVFSSMKIPYLRGKDVSYPAKIELAREFFFKIANDQRRWIASLDSKGTGFVQTSTDRLRGRKLFVWGSSVGGRRWQDYLSQPGRAYVEIQAGLARTQAESVPMPGKTEWSWTEAFGLLTADSGIVHSPDWREAWQGVDRSLEAVLSRREVERIDKELATVATYRPVEFFQKGSGWGALERYRCRIQQKTDTIGPEFVFDESTLGEAQRPWIDLMANGRLPDLEVSEIPASWMIQSDYESLLIESIQGDIKNKTAWLSWVHIGIMRYERGDIEGARDAWHSSIRSKASMWSYRNLAAVSVRAKEFFKAKVYYEKAWDHGPKRAELAVEHLQNLNELKDYTGINEFIRALPPEVRSHERVHIWSAMAAIERDEFEGIESLFEREFVTIREGEETLTNIWYRYQAKRLAKAENRPLDEELMRRVRAECPPPKNINYQMFNEDYFKAKV